MNTYLLDTFDFGMIAVSKEEFEHVQSQFTPLWEDEQTGNKYYFRVETVGNDIIGSRVLYSQPEKRKEIAYSDFEQYLISLAKDGNTVEILKAVQKFAQ